MTYNDIQVLLYVLQADPIEAIKAYMRYLGN